jgi:hypothetical protein
MKIRLDRLCDNPQRDAHSKKINAIRVLRAHFGWSIPEAKDKVEDLPLTLMVGSALILENLRESFDITVLTSDAPVHPEHDKLAKVKDQTQVCGEFLEWLLQAKHYHLAEYHMHTRACLRPDATPCCGYVEGESLVAVNKPVQGLLAEFFKIDRDALEREKQEMLEEQRALTERR